MGGSIFFSRPSSADHSLDFLNKNNHEVCSDCLGFCGPANPGPCPSLPRPHFSPAGSQVQGPGRALQLHQATSHQLGIDNFLDIGTGLSNALSFQANGEIATLDRLATLKANGYGDLAGRLEYSANLGLTSGERGLEALKLMASGGGLSDIESLKDIGMKS